MRVRATRSNTPLNSITLNRLQLKNTSIQDLLSHLKIFLPGDNLLRKYANEKPPLRSELFSADQMAQYGKTLAGRHQLVTGRAPNEWLKPLPNNEEGLLEVLALLTYAVTYT